MKTTKLLAFIALCYAFAAPQAAELNLAVANSTCSAIKRSGNLFAQRSGHTLHYTCKSSGLLAKGLKGRAIHADIYISASKRWMDYMIDNRLVEQQFVSSPWGNVLVVASAGNSQISMTEWSELASEQVKTILIGDPGKAPFGRYAKQALQSTGLWDKVKMKVTTKKHITLLAETLAASDDNTVGILFVSNITNKHRKLLTVNSEWHTPIRYYMAPIGDASSNPAVIEFMDFIKGNDAGRIFRDEGFGVYPQ